VRQPARRSAVARYPGCLQLDGPPGRVVHLRHGQPEPIPETAQPLTADFPSQARWRRGHRPPVTVTPRLPCGRCRTPRGQQAFDGGSGPVQLPLMHERMGSAQRSGQRGMQTWSWPLRSCQPLPVGLLVATHASTTTRTCAGIRATTTAGGIPASSTRKPGQSTSVCSLSAPYSVRRRAPGRLCHAPEVSVPGTT